MLGWPPGVSGHRRRLADVARCPSSVSGSNPQNPEIANRCGGSGLHRLYSIGVEGGGRQTDRHLVFTRLAPTWTLSWRGSCGLS